jgi:formylglycine-generating enzyme required for sulfatase activity
VKRLFLGILAGVAGAAAIAAVPSALPGAPPFPVWTESVTGIEFELLPAGAFRMGSPEDEPGHEAQEVAHPVTLSRAFWLGRTEVTQAQWRRVLGSNPSKFVAVGPDAPVEQVTWYEVSRFLRRLGELSPGNRFRLPTEAEWEYACRAGTTTAYVTGALLTTDQANYDGRYPLPGQNPGVNRDRTTPVASFAPNPWGLFDLHGNVWEWTADEHCPYRAGAVTDPTDACGAALKVIRGGSFYFDADSARCALRYSHRPQDRGPSLGFRVVREPVESTAPRAPGRERMRR